MLFGPSGSGKTLMLDSIAGFVRPDEGRILLDDDILFDGAAGVHLAPQARNCGYVFQNYALFPHMTLRENLEFAAERRPRLERHRRVNEMLERFRLERSRGPPSARGFRRPAPALLHRPRADRRAEAAAARRARAGPGRAAAQPNSTKCCARCAPDFKTPMLLVTHDLDECFELGEEMLILREGRIVQSGTPRKILDQPANLDVARLLGAFNLLAGEIRALDPGRNTSRVQIGEFELDGPYFPGRLKGDRVTVCVRPEQLRVVSAKRPSRPESNSSGVAERAVEKPQWMRLEFSGGIAVDLPRREYERLRDTHDWVVEFPSDCLRVL